MKNGVYSIVAPAGVMLVILVVMHYLKLILKILDISQEAKQIAQDGGLAAQLYLLNVHVVVI